MNEIKSITHWNALASELLKAGYTLYQMQYGTYAPEGFHAWFWASGRPQVEIVTHNYDVYTAIYAYKQKLKKPGR